MKAEELWQGQVPGTPGLELPFSNVPFARDSLREQTYIRIKTAIVTGILHPGAIYPVKFFADRFGVSRTPVREALLDLAGRGFVEALPNRGFRIIPVTEKDQDDIAEVRAMLEVPAMAGLAESISGDVVAAARQLCEETIVAADKGDLVRFLEADRVFHTYLVSQCNNGHLTRMVAELRERMHLHGMPHLAETGRLIAAGGEHAELVDALAVHDSERTQRVMRAHLMHLRSDWAGHSDDDFPEAEAPGNNG